MDVTKIHNDGLKKGRRKVVLSPRLLATLYLRCSYNNKNRTMSRCFPYHFCGISSDYIGAIGMSMEKLEEIFPVRAWIAFNQSIKMN